MNTDFGKFAEQLLYYLCSRCVITVPYHPINKKNDGGHNHNGEILKYLGNRPPSSAGIITAYRYWRSCRPPQNIEAGMAAALATRTLPGTLTPTECAVNLIMQHSTDTWLRHGAEHPQHTYYHSDQPWPDLQSRHSVGSAVMDDPAAGWFAVDLDNHPFQAFVEHPVENHLGPPWSYTVGLLPYREFQRRRGELMHPADRDHLYARAQVPAQCWVFLYRDLDQHAQEPQLQQQAQSRLLTSTVPSIHYDDYVWLTRALRHLNNLARVRPSRLR